MKSDWAHLLAVFLNFIIYYSINRLFHCSLCNIVYRGPSNQFKITMIKEICCMSPHNLNPPLIPTSLFGDRSFDIGPLPKLPFLNFANMSKRGESYLNEKTHFTHIHFLVQIIIRAKPFKELPPFVIRLRCVAIGLVKLWLSIFTQVQRNSAWSILQHPSLEQTKQLFLYRNWVSHWLEKLFKNLNYTLHAKDSLGYIGKSIQLVLANKNWPAQLRCGCCYFDKRILFEYNWHIFRWLHGQKIDGWLLRLCFESQRWNISIIIRQHFLEKQS